jgi:hypothetical protein
MAVKINLFEEASAQSLWIRSDTNSVWRISARNEHFGSFEQAVEALYDSLPTYIVFCQRTPKGYDVFRNGQLLTSPKTEWDLELCLNSEGIHEQFCEEFLRRLRETGTAEEECPSICFKAL